MTCNIIDVGDGRIGILCSRGGRKDPGRCFYCSSPCYRECDYPVVNTVVEYKTCDRKMCEECALTIGKMDFCFEHRDDGLVPSVIVGNIRNTQKGIYIGRPNSTYAISAKGSPLANPFKTGAPEVVLEMYRAKLEADCLNVVLVNYTINQIIQNIRDAGEPALLLCWCKNGRKGTPCHGDVVKEFVERMMKNGDWK